MCLRLSVDPENKKFVERLRKAGRRGIIVYKEYNLLDKSYYRYPISLEPHYLESPYRGRLTKIPKDRNKDIVIRSDRETKKLTKEEIRYNAVYKGIHVYLYKKPSTMYHAVKVYYKDFVGVGRFDCSASAVFMEITFLTKRLVKILKQVEESKNVSNSI